MAVHNIEVRLLPGLERVQLKGINITASDEGFGWNLSASGPEHLFDQLAPVGGVPRQVRVTMDGIDWVFAVQRPQRSRTFRERSVTVTGFSVTALLGEDYMPSRTWGSTGPLTAQQIVAAALEFTGVSIDWQINDWLVPAAAWSHQGSPLSVARRIAEAAGAALSSHRTDAVLQFKPKFQHMPWEWASATPTVRMPGHIVTKDQLQPIAAPGHNTVFVLGTVEGSAKAEVFIRGTARDLIAPQVTDALMSDEVAARQRGRYVLASANITGRQPITVPLLTGGTMPGVMLPGYLLEVIEPDETWRGVVRSVSISESAPRIEQSLTVDRTLI